MNASENDGAGLPDFLKVMMEQEARPILEDLPDSEREAVQSMMKTLMTASDPSEIREIAQSIAAVGKAEKQARASSTGPSIVLVDTTADTLTISWPMVRGAERYVLEYRAANGGAWIIASQNLKSTLARKKNMSKRTSPYYFFRVAAILADGSQTTWVSHDERFELVGMGTGRFATRISTPPVARPYPENGSSDYSAVVSWEEFKAIPCADIATLSTEEAQSNMESGAEEFVYGNILNAMFAYEYEVQARENVGGSSWVTIIENTASTEVLVKDLTSRAGYMFRVAPSRSQDGRFIRGMACSNFPSPPSEVMIVPASSGEQEEAATTQENSGSMKGVWNENPDPMVCAQSQCQARLTNNTATDIKICCGVMLCTKCSSKDDRSKRCISCRMRRKPESDSGKFEMLHQRAESGKPWGQYALAATFCSMMEGLSVSIDDSDARAMYWFEKASEKGHPTAISCLALSFLEGRGCGIDLSNARRFFEILATVPGRNEQAIDGLVRVAEAYVKESMNQEAEQIVAPLAAAGNPRAKCILGNLRLESKPSQGETLLKEAADQGSVKPAWLLAQHYMDKDQRGLAKVWTAQTKKRLTKEDEELVPASTTSNDKALEEKKQALRVAKRACGACAASLESVVTLLVCADCRAYSYCDRECQKHHWSLGGHKEECKAVIALKKELAAKKAK